LCKRRILRSLCSACLSLAALIGVLISAQANVQAQTTSIPILVYHRFSAVQTGSTTVRTAAFELQLQWLADHHYQVLPLRSVLATLRNPHGAFAQPAVTITADDGDESVYTDMYPLVLRLHMPITLFIFPSAVSRSRSVLTWEQIGTMQRSGLVDVESHTYWHPNFRTERARLSPSAYRAFVDFQLQRSRSVLEQKLGTSVTLLAWPYGIYDPELEAAATRAGYVAAFTFGGGLARPGCDILAIPRIPVAGAETGSQFAALLAGPAQHGGNR
jgi:peptidoglycan/xylan/chitin deacetylase (PgdA/CDA1 family)